MKFILVAASLVISFSSFSASLKEKKQLTDWTTQLSDPENSQVQVVKDKCGVAVPVKLDEKFVATFLPLNVSAASFCDSVRSGIATLCGDKMSKEAITKKIKGIDCRPGKDEEITFKWNGGVLDVTLGPSAANIEDKTKTWLENNL